MLRKTQARLFLGFLVCISIPAALGPIVYKYQLDRDALDLASKAVKQAQLEMQHAFQFTRDFINFGQRDVEFFKSGRSDYLLSIADSMEKSQAALAGLQSLGNADLHPAADEIVARLDEYGATVTRLTGLLRERGFSDYGVVGRMRSAVHSLERDVGAPGLLVHVLSLRRYEKDYIIRNRASYVDALMDRARTLEAELQSSAALSMEQRTGLILSLQDYLAAFRQLVSVDETTGIRSGAGLFGSLILQEDELTACFDRLQAALEGYDDAETRSLTNYLQAGIGLAAALSIILGLVLSRKLTGPLTVLSGRMQAYVESEFRDEANLDEIADRDDEVGQLARDFVSLQQAIKVYVSSIREMAYFDMLTGVASRAYLNQRLNEMISAATRRNEGLSLFFVDLDAFKDVNDSLGHDAGDQLLVEVAARLKAVARRSDFVARLGGDEFCMLLEGLSDEADIAVLADRCISNIEMPVTINGKTFKPQASIGISRFPLDGSDAEELMRAGDNAMYAAKTARHHRFEFFRKEMTQKAADRLMFAQEIRAAFRNEEFILFYQPQVDIGSGHVSGWEALVRWRHPSRGMVPPNDFVPEIERLGLINDLGSWVIREACRQMAAWKAQGLGDIRVSVNVAPRQLSDKTLFTTVSEALSAARIEPKRLGLEVTESGIQSTPDGREVLNQLKSLGVRVAIDDFGTGYSSLGSLKHLPIDCLKIDRSFIRDMVHDPEDAVLLGTIMALGHALECDIVAEGVEDVEQLQILQGLGCDTVQGFFFSKPVPSEEVPELARRNFMEHRSGKDKKTPTKKLAS